MATLRRRRDSVVASRRTGQRFRRTMLDPQRTRSNSTGWPTVGRIGRPLVRQNSATRSCSEPIRSKLGTGMIVVGVEQDRMEAGRRRRGDVHRHRVTHVGDPPGLELAERRERMVEDRRVGLGDPDHVAVDDHPHLDVVARHRPGRCGGATSPRSGRSRSTRHPSEPGPLRTESSAARDSGITHRHVWW